MTDPVAAPAITRLRAHGNSHVPVQRPTTGVRIAGLDRHRLERMLAGGLDDNGAAIAPFVDDAGGWPLRCCLGWSVPGERLAIVACSPFPDDWSQSAYRTTGPVVVHVDECGVPDGRLPVRFQANPKVLRAYGSDGERRQTMRYDLGRVVDAGDGLIAEVATMLDDERVEFVHAHNLVAGCFAFAAYRELG